MRPFHVRTEEGQELFSLAEDGSIHMIPTLTMEDAVGYSLAALIQQRDRMLDMQRAIQFLQVDRWFNAVCDGVSVYKALPPATRRRISRRTVTEVLDAVAEVAKREVN